MTTASGTVQLPAKPQQPGLAAIADELGIARGVKGWRDHVRSRLGESALHREYLESVASANPRNAALLAAGLGHLIGGRFERTKSGSWGMVFGGRCVALTPRECEALGLAADPEVCAAIDEALDAIESD